MTENWVAERKKKYRKTNADQLQASVFTRKSNMSSPPPKKCVTDTKPSHGRSPAPESNLEHRCRCAIEPFASVWSVRSVWNVLYGPVFMWIIAAYCNNSSLCTPCHSAASFLAHQPLSDAHARLVHGERYGALRRRISYVCVPNESKILRRTVWFSTITLYKGTIKHKDSARKTSNSRFYFAKSNIHK